MGPSFRRGWDTVAFQVCVQGMLIKFQGIWASAAYQGYNELPRPARMAAKQRIKVKVKVVV